MPRPIPSDIPINCIFASLPVRPRNIRSYHINYLIFEWNYILINFILPVLKFSRFYGMIIKS